MYRATIAKLGFVWLLAVPAAAQIGGSGSIQGVITDPTGAVIPGAAVVATNAATGVETRRETTAAGVYSLSPLAAGEYTVTASANGFQTTVQQHVKVDALSVVGLNLKLTLGAASQSATPAWGRRCATTCTPTCRWPWATRRAISPPSRA